MNRDQSARKNCRVTRIDTHVVSARWLSRGFAQAYTDDGIRGIGQGTCERQATAVEAAIRRLTHRTMIGESACQIELPWERMFRNELARGGPILTAAIGAMEMALWDVVAKALDRPIHDLLGGRVRDRLPAYADAW